MHFTFFIVYILVKPIIKVMLISIAYLMRVSLYIFQNKLSYGDHFLAEIVSFRSGRTPQPLSSHIIEASAFQSPKSCLTSSWIYFFF